MIPLVTVLALALVGGPLLVVYLWLRRRQRSLRGTTVYRLFTYGYLVGTVVALVGLWSMVAVSTSFSPVSTPVGSVKPVALRDVGLVGALAGLTMAAASSVAVSNPDWFPTGWQG